MKILKWSPEFLKKIGIHKLLVYLMMNLETICTGLCIKCALPGYRRDMGRPLTFSQRLRVLDVAKRIGIEALVIVGAGEPTENFDLIKPIIKAAYDRGMGTIMFTTASHLNEEQAIFYRDHDVSIIVSLDSLDSDTYRYLTGNGNLDQVLKNIEILRSTYEGTAIGDVVQLGINVTVCKQNMYELDVIKAFAGNDVAFFVNPPIRRGKLARNKAWDNLVGNSYEELQKLACEKSDTGGHSSIECGVCSYFRKGIGVDGDGEFISCGYASETAGLLGNVNDANPDDFIQQYNRIRDTFDAFAAEIGEVPSCPLRSEHYPRFIEMLKN